jgi:hypothetical protein
MIFNIYQIEKSIYLDYNFIIFFIINYKKYKNNM